VLLRKRRTRRTDTAPLTTTAVLDSGPQIAELANQVRDLKETVNILIAQIQALRSDVKDRKGTHWRKE
jgi:outer membrane murein-binding lipoprotein Lpp